MYAPRFALMGSVGGYAPHAQGYAPRHALMGRCASTPFPGSVQQGEFWCAPDGTPMAPVDRAPVNYGGQYNYGAPAHMRDRAPMNYGYSGNYGGPAQVQVQPPPPGCCPSTIPGLYGLPVVNTSTSGILNLQTPNCTKARTYPINFGDGVTAIAAGATQSFTARPQMTFKPNRIFCPSFIAQNFLLTAFKIGTQDQVADASGNGLSLQIFSEVSVGSNVDYDTAVVGIDMLITVRNISPSPSAFTLTVFGPSVE